MAGRDDQKLQVQQANDIVRLIGEQLALTPRGREFIGLCPFHDDTHPSLYVSPIKQIYKCFSCGAGGDAFSFVMHYHKMTFPEALQYLAERAGIKLQPVRNVGAAGRAGASSGTDEQLTDRELLLRVSALALQFFRNTLEHPEQGRPAREYLAQCGIDAAAIDAFQIGYAPDGWDGLVRAIAQGRWSQRGFELAGLVLPRREGAGCYDQFRHRVIFPICDVMGRPIAFGARKLRPEDEPKYLNSRETALFSKSGTLYALHLAKKAIIESRTAIVVEGYTDAIACHQAGVRNVVATLGTALTRQHMQALSRLCDRVVLIFDSDQAGFKAADRAVELFLAGSLDIAVATLPEGLDPADLLRRPEGLAAWHQAVDRATEALEYKLIRMRSDLAAAGTMAGRQKVAERYLSELAQLGARRLGVLRRAMVVQRLAELLGLAPAAVDSLLKKPSVNLRAPALAGADRRPVKVYHPAGADSHPSLVATGSAARINAQEAAEEQLIGCLLQYPELFHHSLSDGRTLDEAVTPAEVVGPVARRLYAWIYELLSEQRQPTLASVAAELAAQGEHELVELATRVEWEVERLALGQRETVEALLRAAADRILQAGEEQQYAQAREALARLGDGGAPRPDQAQQLLRRIVEHRRANPSPARIARLPEGRR